MNGNVRSKTCAKHRFIAMFAAYHISRLKYLKKIKVNMSYSTNFHSFLPFSLFHHLMYSQNVDYAYVNPNRFVLQILCYIKYMQPFVPNVYGSEH